MFSRCLLLATLQIRSCLCQYMVDSNVRADVAFDDQNDRFDITNIIEEQNRMFDDQPTAMDYDTRRSAFHETIPLDEIIKQNRRQISARSPHRRANDDYDDRIDETNRPDYDDAYERNLRAFKTQNRRNGGLEVIDIEQLGRVMHRRSKGQEINVESNRKSLQDMVLKYLHQGKGMKRRNGEMDRDNELTLKYAVPFNVQVKGYLEPQGE